MKKKKFDPESIKFYPFTVVVKWGGVRPSNPFYLRLKILNEKYSEKLDAIQQAVFGVYMCTSNEVARLLANVADDYGATFVLITQGVVEQFSLKDVDIDNYAKFNEQLPKVGRPRKAAI